MPIVLEGEGDYSLTAVKDVQVTEEFLGLGEGMTKCQTEEYRDDCLTERFSREILSSCDCSPLHLATHLGNKVQVDRDEATIQLCNSRPRPVPHVSWTVLTWCQWTLRSVSSTARGALLTSTDSTTPSTTML